MKEINPNLLPPGGFRFKDEDGVKHTAKTLGELVTAVKKHRERIGREAGDPLHEVVDQICKRSPQVCREVAAPAKEPAGPEYNGKALATLVVSKLGHLFTATKGAAELADPATVAERLHVCSKCPLNVEWESHCPPCKQRAAQVLSLVVRPRKPLAELKGRACLAAADDLSVAILLEKPGRVPHDAPEHCWRRQSV